MKVGLFFVLVSMVVCTFGSSIPNGFIPLQPLPFQQTTQKPQPTPKPTLPPITKKPTTKPPVTPAPTPPPTQPPTAAPTAAPTQPPRTAAPTQAPSSTTNPKNCGLNVNIPQANCNGGNSVVQQTLAALKKELANTRQQHQTQNAAVQTMISQLQGQQTGYLTKIADLQSEVRNLVAAFNSLSGPPSSTTSPISVTPSSSGSLPASAVRQAISNVRNDMQHAVTDLNNKIFNLTLKMQGDQLQETKLHQAIEAQIQNQAGQIGRVAQQVSDLNRQLQLLNTSSSGSTGISSSTIAQLKAQIQKVAADIQQYDMKQQSKITGLTQQAASLALSVSNHSSNIRGLQLQTQLAQSSLGSLKNDVTVVHDALAIFRANTRTQMSNLDNDIKDLKTNVSTVDANVKAFARTALTATQQSVQATRQISGLTSQVTQVKKDITTIQGALQKQGTEVASIKQGVIDLKKAVPITELDNMKNVVLVAINHGNITQQDLKDLADSITKITAKLSQISLPTPSG